MSRDRRLQGTHRSVLAFPHSRLGIAASCLQIPYLYIRKVRVSRTRPGRRTSRTIISSGARRVAALRIRFSQSTLRISNNHPQARLAGAQDGTLSARAGPTHHG